MLRATFAMVILLAAGCQHASAPAPLNSFIITNVSLLDGTGAPARPAVVHIVGERIERVDEPARLPARVGERVVDGGGLTLAPGFIDTHSHADRALRRGSDASGALSQGITTVVVGQDGGSPFPLSQFFAALEQRGLPLNVASYVGHGTIRSRVLGDDYKRHATAAEILRMKERLQQELSAGALGLSSGLEYDPGIYSAPAEVIELANVTAAARGRYISHI
ncbi:MAG: amidohydrolase family protein [Longimicrobiales bacterium]